MLFILLYCFDRVNAECNMIQEEQNSGTYSGQLGTGKQNVKHSLITNDTMYEMNYKIPLKFPLTDSFVENKFTSFCVQINKCEGEICESVRKYEAIRGEKHES